jgi:hypothetical protein
MDAREVLVASVLKKVAFVPGQSFHADGSGKNTMRLNFSNVTPEKLEEGIKRLGGILDHWSPLHGLAAGLALKVDLDRQVNRIKSLVKPRKPKTGVPV